MAALNIPLITWCIIVAAMTVLITVRLFHKNYNPVSTQSRPNYMHETGREHDGYFAHGDIVSNKDKIMNDVDY